jgi:hypothetical protein
LFSYTLKTQNNQQETFMISIVCPFLGPQESMPIEVGEELKSINKRRKEKQLNFQAYIEALKVLFAITSLPVITDDYKLFLAGFIVGEGSINCSVNKNKGKFGFYMDLEFSATQQSYQASYLLSLLTLFNCGRVYAKSGSLSTLVFCIENRQSLVEKVIPFWEKHIQPYEKGFHTPRFGRFKKLLEYFSEKKHLDKTTFRNEMLPLWDLLRKQKGQKNETFPNLQSAQDYLDTYQQE